MDLHLHRVHFLVTIIIITDADAASESLSGDADRDAEHVAGRHTSAAHSALSLQTRTTQRGRYGIGYNRG